MKYHDLVIEQRIKYLPIERLMLNVLKRNQNPDDRRDPSIVLEQYSDLFKRVEKPESAIATVKTEDLKKWVERAIKLEFFDLFGPQYDFRSSEDVDKALSGRI